MDRVETLLTQMARVLAECSEQIAELTGLGLSLGKHEQRLREFQRKLERAPAIKVTDERAQELFLRAAELQSSLIAEEYKYYISASTEAEMMRRTNGLEPDLRAEARRAIKRYRDVRIPRANPVTLKKTHAVAEEVVTWAEEQTVRVRFERKFRCRFPTKGRGDQVAQAS